ncbi:MAG TPA: hypothetical protein VMH87_03335 [Pseudomonadales bacterium]|nr:hypothetical protein [Pseudomonadales bacterium]
MAKFLLLIFSGVCLSASAQVTYTGTTIADAFLATGSPDNPVGSDLTGDNFGAAGTLAISPASADKGAFQSVIRFNFSDAVTLFNSAYGANAWKITAISLTLTSNYGTGGVQPNNKIFNVINGGQFVIEWLLNDDWVEGTGTPALPTSDGVTWNSLPDLLSGPHEILSTNTYAPPGNNVPVTYPLPLGTNLLANIVSGGDMSLLFYPADNQIGYLFNSHEYGRGNDPLINVTAVPLLEIISGYFTNGVFHLTGVGGPGRPYQVQANSDLNQTNWLTLGTVMADTNGTIQFNDNSATNQQRFYRLSGGIGE